MKKTFSFAASAVLCLVLAALLAGAFHTQAAPLSAPVGEETLWHDQSIGTGGATATVETGPTDKLTFFLHVDAPSAEETITVTWQQRATVGSYTYTTSGTSHVIENFTTAQDYVTYTASSAGLLYPAHLFSVETHTGTVTADLLKVQK